MPATVSIKIVVDHRIDNQFCPSTMASTTTTPTTMRQSNTDDDCNSSQKLDPIVKAACDLAISSAFGGSAGASYHPIGPSADTAFSGSFVLELGVTTESMGVETFEHVVIKHSSVRSLHSSFETEEAKKSKKYAAAVKTDKSSRNECAFLKAYWERLITHNYNKTKIPRVLFARDHPTEGVTILMESLATFGKNGSSIRIDEIPLGPRLDAALEWLAYFHAAFLPESVNPNAFDQNFPSEAQSQSNTKPHPEFLWSAGTHLSLEKRAPNELDDLPKELTAFVGRFESEHEYFRTDAAAKEQGRRIQAVAEGVAATLHPKNNPARRTVVHGDYKQGNMFFDYNNDTNKSSMGVEIGEKSGKDRDGDVIAIFDWQWTGPGIGATDLVYLCVMAVSDECLMDYERSILKPYHTFLLKALHHSSKKDGDGGNKRIDYPYGTLVDEFKLAVIDIQRWLGGSRYKSMTPESVTMAQENVDVNHGIFRRSIDRLVWIFRTVDAALDSVESGKIKLFPSPSASENAFKDCI